MSNHTPVNENVKRRENRKNSQEKLTHWKDSEYYPEQYCELRKLKQGTLKHAR